MKIKTPLITLAVGLVLAGVLYVVNVNVTNARDRGDTATAAAPETPGPSPTAAPAPTAGDGSGPAATEGTLTYAGDVDGGGASLAIVVDNGKAIAYVCDGRAAEAWLEGTMADGLIALAGAEGSLTGTYRAADATGDVTAAGKTWHFTIAIALAPSGAYRSASDLRDRLDASWVVLPDGRQVGVDSTGGTPKPAQPFDLVSQTITVDGTIVPIVSSDPTA